MTKRRTILDETADAMQILRDRIELMTNRIELGERVATGLRQENTNYSQPWFGVTRPKAIVTMRAIAAWTSLEYVEACGFTEEAYCR